MALWGPEKSLRRRTSLRSHAALVQSATEVQMGNHEMRISTILYLRNAGYSPRGFQGKLIVLRHLSHEYSNMSRFIAKNFRLEINIFDPVIVCLHVLFNLI